MHYKLTYFDTRGFGEVARLLFLLADVEFEDYRLTIEEFKKIKQSLPCGQVPVLQVDGFEIAQSAAIYRYLARKFGFVGETAEEQATADAIVDYFKDFMTSFKHYGAGWFFGKSQEELDRARKEIVEPACEIYLAVLRKYLKASPSGFIAGGTRLTFADLVIFESLTTLVNTRFIDLKWDAELGEFHRKIGNYPKLKEYFETRPFSML